MKHLPEILFVAALLVIAVGIAWASSPVYDGVGDDPPEPSWWKPFEYNTGIPLPEDLQCILHNACLENDVPEEYALAVIETESGFNADADSGCAHGYMQLHHAYYDPNMPPGENIIAGVKLLGDNFKEYGSWPAAITAYAVGHDNGTRAYWMHIEYKSQRWIEVLQ